MKIKIISQNVTRLNDPATLDNLHNYIRKNFVDFLFIQEQKFRGQGALNLGRALWRLVTTFCTKVEIGYMPDGRNVGCECFNLPPAEVKRAHGF